jgi:sulfate/thiosulfate transport system substrate-binding protein
MKKHLLIVLGMLLTVVSVSTAQSSTIILTIAGYTTPREAYSEIIPLFQQYWLEQTGQTVEFQQSYLSSGAQSRAVEGGFEADIVSFALKSDVTRLVNAGLITRDWQANPAHGFVTTSLVVLVVRPDNPKNILDWADIAREDIEIITPDPATSGGARWNIMGLYGAVLRGYVDGYEATPEGAYSFLVNTLRNVSVFDSSARDSVITYSQGIGDVLITYENEYFAGIAAGDEYTIVYPRSSILIENPVAVVDVYAERKGTLEVADAFVEFLYRPESQAIFIANGFRPFTVSEPSSEATPEATSEALTSASIWAEGTLDTTRFPIIEDIFTVEIFGGWNQISQDFFSDTGIYTQAIAEAQG